MSETEAQCRICFDGVESERELGRLIRPCLCKGSISYVHVQCLEKWRNTSQSNSAFFACPQCHYRYRFARTQVVGLATNPVVLGAVSGLFFTLIVMLASYITTFLMSSFEQPGYGGSYFFFVDPFEVARDLVSATFRILSEGDLGDYLGNPSESTTTTTEATPPGVIKWFIRRFLLGLPLIGAGSIVHMLISMHTLLPVQWLARYRGRRSRRNNSGDIAALIVIGLILLGALRALYKVYKLTETYVQRMLLRAEDAILEVN